MSSTVNLMLLTLLCEKSGAMALVQLDLNYGKQVGCQANEALLHL